MYPHMLIMRNTSEGCIWQAYLVQNEQEERILSTNAGKNGFLVQREEADYTTETSPGWRDTPEWKKCLAKDAGFFTEHLHTNGTVFKSGEGA